MHRFMKTIVLSLALIALPLAAWADQYDDIEKLPPQKKIEEYKKLIEKEPNSEDLLFRLGTAYFDNGFLDEAADMFRKSWQAGEGEKSLLNLIYVLQELKRTDEAAAEFKKAVKKMPNDPLIRARYGEFLSEGADEEEATRLAIEQYRIALDLDPKCVEAHFGLGVLFARTGIYREAIVEWEQVIQIDSRHQLAQSARENIERAREEIGGS